MLAMTGLRAFALAAKRGSEGVSCDADGVFVGGVPLLQPPDARNSFWSARSLVQVNKELSARYQFPIDITPKASSLALIAAALSRRDVAMAAIVAVQMQIPDPAPLALRAESPDEIARRARALSRSGLLKFFWNPALHPRAGVPPNPGWFEPVADKPGPLDVVPGLAIGNPADKPWEPPAAEGEEGENAPRGILELPLPGGSPRALDPGAAPKPSGSLTSSPVEAQPKLPFPAGLPPQLAPYAGGKTFGIFQSPGSGSVVLQSGRNGPAAAIPPESAGFDAYTKTHVEGHAAALMRQEGYMEGTLILSNPDICVRCMSLLPRMLPPGSTLHVILPDKTVIDFEGGSP